MVLEVLIPKSLIHLIFCNSNPEPPMALAAINKCRVIRIVLQQATMICIDNSEWMRNGDYPPTRFQAMAEAVNLVCGAKTQVRLL
jgi:hypothetical protein